MTMVRKMFSVRAAALILVAVLVVLAMGATARPVHALCCGFEFDTIYYSDCPAKLHEVGECDIDCSGVKTCTGTITSCHTTFRICCSCQP
jgi:hypothetical protein